MRDIRVRAVEIDSDQLTVALMDGRTISVPFAWCPRLLNAAPEQRRHYTVAGGGYGLHSPDIDLTTDALLRGAPAPGRRS